MAECQQDEITEFQSWLANLPAGSTGVSCDANIGVAPSTGFASQTTISSVHAGAGTSAIASVPIASVPSVASGESAQAKAWSQGQSRMSTMRKLAVMSKQVGPGADACKFDVCAGSVSNEGAGGTAGSMQEFAGGEGDRAGCSKVSAGGMSMKDCDVGGGKFAEGSIAQDWTTVFH